MLRKDKIQDTLRPKFTYLEATIEVENPKVKLNTNVGPKISAELIPGFKFLNKLVSKHKDDLKAWTEAGFDTPFSIGARYVSSSCTAQYSLASLLNRSYRTLIALTGR